MSSSPRFWQKLGLGKQSKTSSAASSSNSDRKEGHSMHSSISFNNVHEASLESTEKQMKRFSNMSLRHRASSASLNQQMTASSPPDKLLRRGSYMKPLRRIDPEESNYLKSNEPFTSSNIHDRVSSTRISPDLHQQRKLQIPTRKPSIIDMSQNNNRQNTEQKSSKLRQPSPAIGHAKLLSRSESNSSINSTMTLSKRKKNTPKMSYSSSGDDDNKSLTRSSSNGSSSDRTNNNRRKLSIEKRKSKQTMLESIPAAPGQDFIIDMLKDELEKEKASARSLQGQKEAIAKDLDYFCTLVDEVTEEKETFKQKYEQEKLKNEELRQSLEKLTGVSPKGGGPTVAQLKIELETVQQRATEDQYAYYNNLQFKNDENNKLRYDLKQAQRQIQVLRKTMEQMLRADGKDLDDHFMDEQYNNHSNNQKGAAATMFEGGEKYLLLQTGYHPDQQSPVSAHLIRPTTNPPSPTPCYTAFSHNEDEDILSTTSKESYQSGPLRHPSHHYDFLKYDVKEDDAVSSFAKRKSAEYSKKIAMSRRRKDQLEEMLGEVDSQLNKVKQKMRPS